MTDVSTLWQFPLRRGASDDPRHGACLLDAVSWLTYGQLGDHPECVCPIIARYGRLINDCLDFEDRQKLRVYIPRLVGTVDRPMQQARVEYLIWRAVRNFAPPVLEAYGASKMARELRVANRPLLEAAVLLRRAICVLKESFGEVILLDKGGYAISGSGLVPSEINLSRMAEVTLTKYAGGLADFWMKSVKRHLAAPSVPVKVAFDTLDGLLAIGKQAEPIDPIAFEGAVEQFAMALA